MTGGGADAAGPPTSPIPPTSPLSAPDPAATAVQPVGAPSSSRSARLVAAGILLSRIAGLIRERVFAQYFGMSLYADAFRAALRMPNVLQNLLGEGTLSASFIPVYAELLEKGRDEEAGRVAGAVFALLLALAGGLSLIGLLLAPVIVSVFVPGFEGERRSLTIACVRIIFPMTGLLVLSAWALGILNSRRRFFISYVAPVLWNVAMIATMVFFGARMVQADLVVALAWGALVGGALQLLVQLPWVLSLERDLRVRWDTRLEGVRTAARNAGPAILGRGVVQLSGYVDVFLASVLAEGAVAALGYAQTLYLLPISLFGISVAAAELPELARGRSGEVDVLRGRVNGGLRQIAVFVVPSTVGYLVLGDVIVAALYETGDFSAADTLFAYLVLAGYTIGLLASTATRLFSSAFFALQDTRTPAKVAALRVAVAAVVGAALMFWLRQYEVRGHSLGALGLSMAAGGAAWIEWALLRRNLKGRIGEVGAGLAFMWKLLGSALAAAVVARIVYHVVPESLVPDSDQLRHIARGVWALAPFAAIYFLGAHALGVREASALGSRVLRRFRR